MSNYICQVLDENSSGFTSGQLSALKTIAKWPNGFDYRKNIEAVEKQIPYLPSFRQKVEDKLKLIGLEILSVPANDGSCCKLYSLRLMTLPSDMERCSRCGFVQSKEDLFFGGCIKCGAENE